MQDRFYHASLNLLITPLMLQGKIKKKLVWKTGRHASQSRRVYMVMLTNLEHPSTREEKLKQRYTVSNLEEMKILIWSNF